MSEVKKGFLALFFSILVCGSLIFGISLGTLIKDISYYEDGDGHTDGYNYDITVEFTDHEERILSQMTIGFALIGGASFGIGFMKKDI